MPLPRQGRFPASIIEERAIQAHLQQWADGLRLPGLLSNLLMPAVSGRKYKMMPRPEQRSDASPGCSASTAAPRAGTISKSSGSAQRDACIHRHGGRSGAGRHRFHRSLTIVSWTKYRDNPGPSPGVRESLAAFRRHFTGIWFSSVMGHNCHGHHQKGDVEDRPQSGSNGGGTAAAVPPVSVRMFTAQKSSSPASVSWLSGAWTGITDGM